MDLIVCEGNVFLETLSSDEKGSVVYLWSDTTAKTRWINLTVSGHPRSGLTFDELDSDSVSAELSLAKAVQVMTDMRILRESVSLSYLGR